MAVSLTSKKRDCKEIQREIHEDIKEKTKGVIEDRKKLNGIIDIQSHLENPDPTIVKISIKALDKIFCHLLGSDLLFADASLMNTADKKVQEWSQGQYIDFQKCLLGFIASDKISLQEQALVSLMHMLQAEGNSQRLHATEGKQQFPLDLLERVVICLLSLDSESTPAVLTRFQEFLEYEDLLFHLLRVLGKVLKAKSNVDETFLKNLIQLLDHVTIHDSNDEQKGKHFCSDDVKFQWNYTQAKKYFSTVWQQVLKCPLSPSLYKRVLVLLPDKVIPHLEKPLLLTDFLMESYKIGGVVSILALHGVFLLMQNYNLEYPDFYQKLYTLLEPGVLFVKYRARFFYLLDLFMTSTHVPEYIAAAFAKRLSRLSLIAPPNVIILLLHFIGNLIIRHKGLVRLMNSPSSVQDTKCDPYNMEESDLNACKATESSLWEIKTLQSHVIPEVAYTAKFIDRDLPKMEWQVHQYLELTMEDMLEKELKRKSEDVPLNFERPSKFSCVKNDRLSEYFEVV